MSSEKSRVEEILPNVYEITWQRKDEGPEIMQGMQWRTYFFDFDYDVPTLIDTCKRERLEQFTEGLDEIDTDPERLIITHKHSDHVDGFDAIVDRYDVETWVPKHDELTSAERVSVQTPADHLYDDGEEIGSFTTVHVPGHTPGNSSIINERAGIAIMGDTVSGADRRGLPAGYLIHPPQSTNVRMPAEACIDAEENLVNLLDYEFEVALVNHGSNVYEDGHEKLEAYVNFEKNYTSEDDSMHQPDRGGLGDRPDFYAD